MMPIDFSKGRQKELSVTCVRCLALRILVPPKHHDDKQTNKQTAAHRLEFGFLLTYQTEPIVASGEHHPLEEEGCVG